MQNLLHFKSIAEFITLFANFSYPKIFLALLASGHVIPIPEGVTLILLGYVANIGSKTLFGVMGIGIFSVLFFDMLLYSISRSGSGLALWLSKKAKVHLLERYKNIRDRETLFLVVVSHVVPGWRFANPIIAGMAEVGWKKFFVFSLVAASIYAPLYILIGFYFHTKVLYLLALFKSFNRFLLPITLIGVGVGILVYVILENRKAIYNTTYAKE